jgi:hypothetical protein
MKAYWGNGGIAPRILNLTLVLVRSILSFPVSSVLSSVILMLSYYLHDFLFIYTSPRLCGFSPLPCLHTSAYSYASQLLHNFFFLYLLTYSHCCSFFSRLGVEKCTPVAHSTFRSTICDSACLIGIYIHFIAKLIQHKCDTAYRQYGFLVRVCIQKFPDRVDNEINAYVWYYSLRSNTKGYGGKTHYTDSQNSDKTAPNCRELCHFQFWLQVASPETFGYTVVFRYVLI